LFKISKVIILFIFIKHFNHKLIKINTIFLGALFTEQIVEEEASEDENNRTNTNGTNSPSSRYVYFGLGIFIMKKIKSPKKNCRFFFEN
jgi:hypothetical protein